jgi:mono/diheme cytochrome c family protein
VRFSSDARPRERFVIPAFLNSRDSDLTREFESARGNGSRGAAYRGAVYLGAGLGVFLALSAGCKGGGGDLLAGKTPEEAALIAKGKTIYATTCTACHNADPKLDGAQGPPVAGASPELVRGKVIENVYPKGYRPKRTTNIMLPLPQLKDDIAAIVAFLRASR